MSTIDSNKILILDFGSQYTQLIARRVREARVYCEIMPFNTSIEIIRDFGARGIILSGGPASVFAEEAPLPDKAIFDLGLPILGICYGMQLIGHTQGGRVATSAKREFGRAKLLIDNQQDLFADLDIVDNTCTVWMSHGDKVEQLPPVLKPSPTPKTPPSPPCAMASVASGPSSSTLKWCTPTKAPPCWPTSYTKSAAANPPGT